VRASLVECLSESSHESILYDPFPDRVNAFGWHLPWHRMRMASGDAKPKRLRFS
jgi:hypothetical protein